jgi:hypothetical protein
MPLSLSSESFEFSFLIYTRVIVGFPTAVLFLDKKGEKYFFVTLADALERPHPAT